MLVAAPFMPLNDVAASNGPPRIISEIRKTTPCITPREQVRPRLSGVLLIIYGNEETWWPRRVIVRGGQLLIGSSPGDGAAGGLRLPLRHLSLAAGPLPNSLAIYRGQNVVLTLQTASERAFDLWVKTIAIEIIRQTPLEAVKYLDVLTLTECWTRKKQSASESDWNFNSIQKNFNDKPENSEETCDRCANEPNDKKNVEVLLKRCQNSESYVPVKDKLVLFETLCRVGRKVRSTEDISLRNVDGSKRTMSLHDLSCFNSTPGVRQMCKYFENKNGETPKYGTINRTRRLIHSDSQLNVKNRLDVKLNSSCN